VIGQPTDHASALGSPLLFTVSAQSRQHRIRPVAKLVSNLLDPKPGLFRNPGMLPQSQRDCGIMTSGSLSDIAQRCPDRRTSHRRDREEPWSDRPSFASGCPINADLNERLKSGAGVTLPKMANPRRAEIFALPILPSDSCWSDRDRPRTAPKPRRTLDKQIWQPGYCRA
jgi:hypothetical protein